MKTASENGSMKALLAGLPGPKFCALRDALAAYVENELTREDVEDPHAANKHLTHAEEILAEIDVMTAELAEAA